ncbi:unnamed protein product [Cylicocyclus nassatus]|uniref:Uncharacterized protein n=1 Tax=Cylicocyclus nassatus TaxID=53992 RepID=A0AA36DKJ5_CYLNA|nr:unnamed protein product [Cylicocyclus nassatus]
MGTGPGPEQNEKQMVKTAKSGPRERGGKSNPESKPRSLGSFGRRRKSKSKKKSKKGKRGTSSSVSSTLTPDTQYEPGVMTCSYWPRVSGKRQSGRLIILMRSAERVDRVFGPDWADTEAPHGYLTPTDLNIPHNNMTKKLLYGKVFVDNPPITPFGKYSAQLTARGICNRGVSPQFIVCTPTLRSIQTADAMARFLKAGLVIEPGLLEPLSWYRAGSESLPDFSLDLICKMYPIDTNYSPVMTMEAIQKLYDRETEQEGLARIDFVLRSLSGEQRKQPLVVVGHAITMAVALAIASSQGDQKGRSTTSDSGTPITSFEYQMSIDTLGNEVIDQTTLGVRFPPGSVVTLIQKNKGPPFLYQLAPNIVPPLSYGELFTNKAVVAT